MVTSDTGFNKSCWGDNVSHANTVDMERLICTKARKAKRKMKEDFVEFMKKKMKVLGIT